VIVFREKRILRYNHHHAVSVLHPSGLAERSNSFGLYDGGKVTAVEWQVTLSDPI